MKILLDDYNDFSYKETIQLSSTENNNLVEIVVNGKEATVSIDELLAAVTALYEATRERHETS